MIAFAQLPLLDSKLVHLLIEAEAIESIHHLEGNPVLLDLLREAADLLVQFAELQPVDALKPSNTGSETFSPIVLSKKEEEV